MTSAFYSNPFGEYDDFDDWDAAEEREIEKGETATAETLVLHPQSITGR